MRILVIDDQRIFKFSGLSPLYLIHSLTSQDGLDQLYNNGPWDEVWLDHDLGPNSEVNGSTIANKIIRDTVSNKGPKVKRYFIHSMNPVGARYMTEGLNNAGLPAIWVVWNEATLNNLLDMDKMKELGKDPFHRA